MIKVVCNMLSILFINKIYKVLKHFYNSMQTNTTPQVVALSIIREFKTLSILKKTDLFHIFAKLHSIDIKWLERLVVLVYLGWQTLIKGLNFFFFWATVI